MTRTILELDHLIREQDKLVTELSRAANAIDRELYRMPNYTIAYGRRLKDLEVARSNYLGAYVQLEALICELDEAINLDFIPA